jgi:hypothetical protein
MRRLEPLFTLRLLTPTLLPEAAEASEDIAKMAEDIFHIHAEPAVPTTTAVI